MLVYSRGSGSRSSIIYKVVVKIAHQTYRALNHQLSKLLQLVIVVCIHIGSALELIHVLEVEVLRDVEVALESLVGLFVQLLELLF